MNKSIWIWIWISIILLIISCNSKKFNKVVWLKNQNQNNDNPRFYMIKDIQNNYLKKGISTNNDVVYLLGNPIETDTFQNQIRLKYSIGSNSGMHIDPYSIIIQFDSLNKYLGMDIIKH